MMDLPPLRTLLPRLFGGLVAFFGAVAGLSYFLYDPITAASTWFITQTGWPGLLISFALTDVLPIMNHAAVLLIGYAGGLPFKTAAMAASVGALLGPCLAWGFGRSLRGWAWLRRRLERYKIADFLARYGTAAVAVASITPIPDSLCIMGIGASGLPLSGALLGSLIRIPKIIIYLFLIQHGWGLGH